MAKKTVCFFMILLFSYFYLFVNYPEAWLHNSLYKSFLAFYGYNAGRNAEVKVLYHKGLRDLGDKEIRVKAFVPGETKNLSEELKKALKEGYTAVVECSLLDSFHTTPYGQVLAKEMYSKAYRIVVFDGGHHLPTLGMAPDVIIIPEIRGYAAHSYMQDAIKVETVVYLAKKACLNTMIVSVPRWALVKEKSNLENIAYKALHRETRRISSFSPFHPCACNRISKVNGLIFAYVEKEYYKDIAGFVKCIKRLGIDDVNEIYLAFDYRFADRESACAYAEDVEDVLKIPVYVVNEPFTAFNVLWGKKHVLRKQGHSP